MSRQIHLCGRVIALTIISALSVVAAFSQSAPSAFARLAFEAVDQTGAAPAGPADSSPPTNARPQTRPISSIDAIGMTVDDMDRSIAFYRDVLSFSIVSDVEVAGEPYERLAGVFGLRLRIVMMQLGDEFIELTEFLVPKGRPVPPDSRSNDRWFQHIAIITPDMDRAYQWLRKNGVRHASSGPQLLPGWNRNAGGIQAFYFHDPDGHVLEILQFPPDKGKPDWRRRAAAASADQMFLGIDHTAIVVADTGQSLKFYRDMLGMVIAGESENHGPEQERLNNVFGARLRITSLRPPRNLAGPAVEFLEYLAPAGGRPYPADARSNDLIHWQMTLATDDLDGFLRALDHADNQFVSTGPVEVDGDDMSFRRAIVVRDPDGHAVRVVER